MLNELCRCFTQQWILPVILQRAVDHLSNSLSYLGIFTQTPLNNHSTKSNPVLSLGTSSSNKRWSVSHYWNTYWYHLNKFQIVSPVLGYHSSLKAQQSHPSQPVISLSLSTLPLPGLPCSHLHESPVDTLNQFYSPTRDIFIPLNLFSLPNLSVL